MKKITVSQVEKAIGSFRWDWEGNCYAIAKKILDSGIVKGKLRYGHWTGDIKEGTLFADCKGLGFCRHAWIELKDGSIVDPTRWVFEGEKPYIYSGQSDYYDAGGNIWRKMNVLPPPIFDKNNKEEKIIDVKLKGDEGAFIKNLLDYPEKITAKHCFWLANLPLDTLGKYAKSIYKLLTNLDMSAFIPIDNYRMVMEE